jgi:hypothetical protein
MSTLLDLLTQAWFVAQLNTSRTNGNYWIRTVRIAFIIESHSMNLDRICDHLVMNFDPWMRTGGGGAKNLEIVHTY